MSEVAEMSGPPTPATPALEVRHLAKTFSETRALGGVDISFRQGAVTALLGPNGCGKSTLIKILAGFHEPDHGSEIEIGGVAAKLPMNAREARRLGLRFLHQDLGLVSTMDVADNFALANDFDGQNSYALARRKHRVDTARVALERLGVEVSPRAIIGELSRTDQIMVAVARAFEADGLDPSQRIVILDEPTASLPAGSVQRVLGTVRNIRDAGGTVIYVTHRIDEVLQIAEDLVVLRDGHVSSRRSLGGLTADELAELISGAAVIRPARRGAVGTGRTMLRFDAIDGSRLREVSFDLASGETLGVAGLAGCGRSELARIAAGVTAPRAGRLHFRGDEVVLNGPRDALKRGIAYVPPHRKELGIIGDFTVRQNITLPDMAKFWRGLRLRPSEERREVMELMNRFDIRPRRSELAISKLSGGNQQKCVIAKLVRLGPKLLVVDEPTQGVDVAGKQEIAEMLRDCAADGCGVVLASSDFDEIADLCDRILVLDRGSLIGIYNRGEIHEREVTILGGRAREQRYDH